MELTTLLIYIGIGLFVLLLVLFPEFRALCLGWTRLFIKDMATTPEGAEAIYAEKIDEAQEAYNKADNALKIAAGKLATEEDRLAKLQKSLKDAEEKCEALVKSNKLELAQIKADERAEKRSDNQYRINYFLRLGGSSERSLHACH